MVQSLDLETTARKDEDLRVSLRLLVLFFVFE